MTLSANELIDQLSRYGLINRLSQGNALNSLDVDQASDSEIVVSHLVDRGHLTQFQARVIRAGQIPNLLVDQYVILDKLGEGGMGVVFKARHKLMDRLVAIKLLTPQLSKRPELGRRFHREIRMQSKLSHPSIVTAFDAGEVRGCLYLAMEYVEGNNLSALVREQGPMLVPRALELIEQAAEGLAFAHRLSVIHRDIKPQNLIVDSFGRLKILDFGLARLHLPWESDSDPAGLAETLPDSAPTPPLPEQAVSELTMAGQIMGTVDYMAPEQVLDSRSVDTRCDIYSLGCTLHFLLTGKVVFPGKSAIEKVIAHREHPIPSLAPVLQGVSKELRQRLEAVFVRMVAKERSDRFSTTDELVNALSQLRVQLNSDLDSRKSAATAVQAGAALGNAAASPSKQNQPGQTPRDQGQRFSGRDRTPQRAESRGLRAGESGRPHRVSSEADPASDDAPPTDRRPNATPAALRTVGPPSGEGRGTAARPRPRLPADSSDTELTTISGEESDAGEAAEPEVPSVWSRTSVRSGLAVGVACIAFVGWTVWNRGGDDSALVIESDQSLTPETDRPALPAQPGDETAPAPKSGNLKRKFKL
jgi:serine/threonine protein kinase